MHTIFGDETSYIAVVYVYKMPLNNVLYTWEREREEGGLLPWRETTYMLIQTCYEKLKNKTLTWPTWRPSANAMSATLSGSGGNRCAGGGGWGATGLSSVGQCKRRPECEPAEEAWRGPRRRRRHTMARHTASNRAITAKAVPKEASNAAPGLRAYSSQPRASPGTVTRVNRSLTWSDNKRQYVCRCLKDNAWFTVHVLCCDGNVRQQYFSYVTVHNWWTVMTRQLWIDTLYKKNIVGVGLSHSTAQHISCAPSIRQWRTS